MGTARRVRQSFGEALYAVTRAAAIPYGYTVTVWCSGAALLHRHGTPAPAEAFLFLFGAVAAYTVVSAPAASLAAEPLEPSPGQQLATGTANLIAAAAAIGAAAAVAQLHGDAAWPLASFCATALFLLLTAGFLALAEAGRPARPSGLGAGP
jgi:hypothetical protein